MHKNRLYLDIHAIQTLPLSNPNRDDTGRPKTADYGGVTRARISSQAWKAAMRDYFRENGPKAGVGIRTKKVLDYVAQKICEKDNSVSMDDAKKKAKNVLNVVNLKPNKDGELDVLFFLGDKQAERLAEAALTGEKDEAVLDKILKENMPIDIALFGRMCADNHTLSEDASSQVAHAISTHEVRTEYDFFTAKDDLDSADQAGASMMGTKELNSSTFYRYANVGIHKFLHQMGDKKEDAIQALRLFIEAFARSIPTGNIHSDAHQTSPQALLVVLRDDCPANLSNAFENPVKAKDGYTATSIRRLFAENMNAEESFYNKPIASWYVLLNKKNLSDEEKSNFDGIEEKKLDQLLDAMDAKLNELL